MESEPDCYSDKCTQLDRVLAIPMFAVSLLFLLTTGALLHLTEENLTSSLGIWLLSGMGFLYVFIVAEAIAHWCTGASNMRQHIVYLLVPMMRICPHDHIDGKLAWVPGLGWQKTSPRLEANLARMFSAPMIVIALLVLPVVVIEFFYDEMITDRQRFAIDTCSGFIWMAFVFEFVVMLSVVKRRLRYCKQNWIDVAIVLLPLVSFMGAARLGRLVKLKQLTRTAKIYRMRGLIIRSWRAVVVLDVIDALLRRDTDRRIEKLQNQIQEKQHEIDQLRNQMKRLQVKTRKKSEDSGGENEANGNAASVS